MGDIRASTGYVLGAVESGGDARVTQVAALAAVQFPSEQVKTTQAFALAAAEYDRDIRVSQAYVLAAVKGSIYDPKVRVWTMTLDGHDLLVFRLGTLNQTLVYDDHTESWYIWSSKTHDKWRAYNGCNWDGASNYAGAYGSNIIVGDDGNGSLYFLDPNKDLDDHPLTGIDDAYPFQRLVMAQRVGAGYDRKKCYAVNILGSTGEGSTTDETLTAITLYTSDNQGHDYTNHGTINVVPEEYDTRLQWRSLGSYKAPGRIFKVEDFGALKRIDYMETEDGETPTGT